MPGAGRPGRTPYGPEAAPARCDADGARAGALRPARDRQRDHRRGHRQRGVQRAGLRVALVDRSDFGGATSSASSKLIHGGLRYLRLGDVKLVREAHTERRALLRVVAPHLVRRIPFLFPVYRGGPYRPATIQAGLWTYSTLAGEKLGGLVRPERARRSVPALRLDGLRGCGVYQDAWTHDGRLCLANVTAAAEAGATVLNFAEVVDLRLAARPRVRGAELRDRLSGDTFSIEARAVVNATGPWLETMRRLEEPGVAAYGQLSKGVHVTLPLDEPWSAALTIPHDQVRVTFAYPWEGMLLLGTTDTPYDGDPAAVTATDGDVDRILAEAAVAVDPHRSGRRTCSRRTRDSGSSPAATARPWTPAARRHSCGARVACSRSLAASSRPTGGSRSTRSPGCRPARALRPRPSAGSAPRCHGCGNVAARLVTGWDLEPSVAAHLAHFYGSRADRVVALEASGPSSSSGCTPTHPTSLLRSCSPRRRNGRRAPTTSCNAERRWAPAALQAPSSALAVVELLEGAAGDSSGAR